MTGSRIRDIVRAVDHAFFNAHPDDEVFLREYIEGEFGSKPLPYKKPPQGTRFATLVKAFRDPVSRKVLLRVRYFRVVPANIRLDWEVSRRARYRNGAQG